MSVKRDPGCADARMRLQADTSTKSRLRLLLGVARSPEEETFCCTPVQRNLREERQTDDRRCDESRKHGRVIHVLESREHTRTCPCKEGGRHESGQCGNNAAMVQAAAGQTGQSKVTVVALVWMMICV